MFAILTAITVLTNLLIFTCVAILVMIDIRAKTAIKFQEKFVTPLKAIRTKKYRTRNIIDSINRSRKSSNLFDIETLLFFLDVSDIFYTIVNFRKCISTFCY